MMHDEHAIFVDDRVGCCPLKYQMEMERSVIAFIHDKYGVHGYLTTLLKPEHSSTVFPTAAFFAPSVSWLRRNPIRVYFTLSY